MKPTNKTTCREVSRRLMLRAQRQETKQAAFNPLTTTKKFSKQRPSRKWLWWLVAAIVLICVILAAVLGGVLGSRASDDDDDDSKDNQSMPKSQTGSDNKPSNLVGVFPQSVFDAASNAAKQGDTDHIAVVANLLGPLSP